MSLSDHVIVMHQGEKLFEGTPDQVRASPLVREAYRGSSMPLLEVDALHARYGYAPVVQGVSFSVDAERSSAFLGVTAPARRRRCGRSWDGCVRRRGALCLQESRSRGCRPTASSARASPSFRRTAVSLRL